MWLVLQIVLALRGSYLVCMVIALEIAKAGRQVPKPRCLSPAAHSLDIRIAGRQVPKAQNSLDPLYWDGRLARATRPIKNVPQKLP